MPHDYVKRRKSTSRKSAPRKRVNRKKNKHALPLWVWWFSGTVTSLFVAFLLYLVNIAPETTPVVAIIEPVADNQDNDRGEDTQFDFYTLLPQRKVIIPPVEQAKPPTQTFFYILQTASFKDRDDADRERAKLLLMGMDASIEQAQDANGTTWYRVQVGPFHSRSKLASARSALAQQGIMPLVLKRPIDD